MLRLLIFIIQYKSSSVLSRAVVAIDTFLSTVEPHVLQQSRQGGSYLAETSVDTVRMACRQSKNRDCRDTVDDRVSTTALVLSNSSNYMISDFMFTHIVHTHFTM